MQPSKVDSSMKWIRKGEPLCCINYSTRTKLIPNNQCQQPYGCAAEQNICAARTQWEVTICSRNPKSFVLSWTWNYIRKVSGWFKPGLNTIPDIQTGMRYLDLPKPCSDRRPLHLNWFCWKTKGLHFEGCLCPNQHTTIQLRDKPRKAIVHCTRRRCKTGDSTHPHGFIAFCGY